MDCVAAELCFCEVLCKSFVKVGEFLKRAPENFCGSKSKKDEEPVKARDKFKRSPGHAVASANTLIHADGWQV